jgi:hypothetical protein
MRAAASSLPVGDRESLFDPDVLLPEQFYATLRRSPGADPEARLMAAILEDAVACLARDARLCSRQQRKAREEAFAWINAREEDDWIFSFTNVCETLGFDPDYLRAGLTRWAAPDRSPAAKVPRIKKYRSGARHRKLRFRSVA